MNFKRRFLLYVVLAGAFAATTVARAGVFENLETAEEAYIYAFPMIAAYKAMYQFNIDKSSDQYKTGFNQIWNDSHVFTPKDTAIVTPNSDTPYSMVQADLRAEPIVLCVPEIEKDRYYSVQLCDMYSCTYGYIGSRATGNDAGCYMVAGPTWSGEKPPGIDKVFQCETQFSLIIYRTQLFNAADTTSRSGATISFMVMLMPSDSMLVTTNKTTGYFLGGPRPANRATLALATGMRGGSAALVVGVSNFPTAPDVVLMILMVLLFGLLTMAPIAATVLRRINIRNHSAA